MRARGALVALGGVMGVLGGACSGSTPSGEAAVPRITDAPPWGERARGGLTPIEPGTRDLALLSAASCQTCHAAEHREWAASRHGQAWVNPTFQREYREHPLAWCVNCHAPLAPQVAEVWPPVRDDGQGPLAREGVGCAACHVRDGRLVARTRRPGSPHDTLTWAGFGSATFCAGCHQFEFPVIDDDDVVRRLSAHPMQKTVAEFTAGPWADEVPGGCRACHAATGARHRYPGAHDPSMLARALALRACRDGDALVLELTNVGVGHNVPSGDLHRHLTLRAWRASAPTQLFDGFLGRRFTPDPAGGKRTTWDSSLKPRERRRYRVELAKLGGAPDEPIDLELAYVYVSDESAAPGRGLGADPHRRVIEARRVLASALEQCAGGAADADADPR